MPRMPDASMLQGRTPRAVRQAPNYSANPIGAALQNLGGELAQFGAQGMAKKASTLADDEKFGAQSRFLQFEQSTRLSAIERARQMAPGGAGFTDGLKQDYVAAADKFWGSIPPELQAEYGPRLLNLEGDLTAKATTLEQEAHDLYALQNIEEGQSVLLNRQAANPASWADVTAEGEEHIRNAGLPPITAEEEVRKWRERRALQLFQTDQVLDAAGARSKLGISAGVRAAPTTDIPPDVYGRAQKARDRLVAKGWTPVQAAGIVGNLVQESGVRHDGPSGDAGTAHGMAQWRGDRFANLKAFAARQGKDWRDFDTQIDFVDWELNNTESSAGAKLRAAATVDDATAAVIGFERPRGWTDANPTAGHGWSNRLAAAQKVAGVPVTAGDTIAVEGEGPDISILTDPAPEYADLPYETRRKLFEESLAAEQAERREAHRLETEREKEEREEIRKTGYDMMLEDDLSGTQTLTREWIEANRDVLTVTDYKVFLKTLTPGSTAKRTPPKEYIRLLDLAETDPEQAIDEVRNLYGSDVIAKDVFNTVMSRARDNLERIGGRSYSSEIRSYVSTSMTPDRDAPQSQYARKLDALFSFDDWLEANPEANREEIRKQAEAIVGDFQKIRYRSGVMSLPPPRFTAKAPEAIDMTELEKALEKTAGSLNAGMIGPREAAEQAAIIRRWMDIVRYRD